MTGQQPERPWETTPEPGRKTPGWIPGLIAVGLVVLVGVLFGTGGGEDGDAGMDPEVERYDAQRVCEDFVKDRLKAPTTAEFETAVTGGGGTYTVTGAVDAENSFGAKVRNQFTCRVRGDGETWHLESLTGLG